MQAVFNALNQMPCDIFIDTMGVGFAYPIAKIFFPVYLYSYTHYPIVSSDMIETVKKGEA
jgi:alpha-1,2-mannosyltransferase